MSDRPTILTYGDIMLDVRVTGSCRRMSPEEPSSPVLLMDGVDVACGGAGNVAANIVSMGGESLLVGSLGKDPAGTMMLHALVAAHVESDLVMREANTTAKVRFINVDQQMMRLDVERIDPLAADEEAVIIERLMGHLPKVRAVVISDYAKGGVTPAVAAKVIVAASTLGVIVIVDSKSPTAPHWRGATVMKPNLPEIAAALGRPEPQTDSEAADAATALRHRCGAQFVVLTRGARGLCLSGDPGVIHVAGHAVKAVDVTGAGDAVAAGLALSAADGESILDAARFANAAGAAAVTKVGTAALSFEEVNFFHDCEARTPRRHGGDVADERSAHRVH